MHTYEKQKMGGRGNHWKEGWEKKAPRTLEPDAVSNWIQSPTEGGGLGGGEPPKKDSKETNKQKNASGLRARICFTKYTPSTNRLAKKQRKRWDEKWPAAAAAAKADLLGRWVYYRSIRGRLGRLKLLLFPLSAFLPPPPPPSRYWWTDRD